MSTANLFWNKKIQSESRSLPIAKVFTVTKDEYDLIESFVNYHGGIFGYDNIVVIDNGSTNEHVLSAYETFKQKGVTITYSTGYAGNLQGEHFTNTMTQYKDKSRFLIPLDTDLFFTVHGSCNKNVICNFLDNLRNDYDMFKMNMFYMSVVDTSSPNYKDNKLTVPTDSTLFVKRRGYGGMPTVQHMFYRSPNFVWTSNGNHVGGSLTNSIGETPDVAYVHFHLTGVSRNIERCVAILDAYGYINSKTQSLQEQFNILSNLNGDGGHRISQYVEHLRKILSGDNAFVEEPIPSDAFIFEELKNALKTSA